MKISTSVSRIIAMGALTALLIVPSFAQTGAKTKAAPAPAPAPAAKAAKPMKTTKGKSSHKMAVHHAKAGKSATKPAPAKKSK